MSKKIDRAGRRAIVAGLGIGATMLAAGAGRVRAEEAPRWQPTLDPLDDWMELPGQHRFVFDSTSPDGGGHALFYARNFFAANKQGYGLDPSALAVIIVLRSQSTPFGYNDTVWKKYGKELSKMSKLKQAHMANPYDGKDAGLANRGVTVSNLIESGAQFAICGMATMGISHALAAQTHGNADDIHKDLVGNLIPNGHLVPAGIVAVNRAQERGYTFAYTG
jgi:intracellular sulfur oxidation DsrE/DsrF family protein